MGDELHWVVSREGQQQRDGWDSAGLSNVHEVIQKFIGLSGKPNDEYLRFAKEYGCLGLQFRQFPRRKVLFEESVEIEFPIVDLPSGYSLTSEKLDEWKRYTQILHFVSISHAQVLKNEPLSPALLDQLGKKCRFKPRYKFTIQSEEKRPRTEQERERERELKRRDFLADVINGLLNKLDLKPQFQYHGFAGKSDDASLDPSLREMMKQIPPLHGRLCLNYSYATGLLDVLVSNFIADLCSLERFKICEYPSCSEKIRFNGNTRYCRQHKSIAKAEKHREQQRRWIAKQKTLRPE